MIFSPSDIPYSELYGILLNSVAPRPIAWVSTSSVSGQPNLAPFSFFNAVCVDPPLLAFAPGLRSAKQMQAAHGQTAAKKLMAGNPSTGDPAADEATAGLAKDTLRNVRDTKEFVVNIVTFDLAEKMNLTSGEYDPSVNEFELAHVTSAPSQVVRAPRVAESPVSFECRLYQILDFSPAPTSSSLVLGQIVSVYINDANLKDGKLDRNSLDLIGRMGGIQYTRTTQRFDMVRPKVG